MSVATIQNQTQNVLSDEPVYVSINVQVPGSPTAENPTGDTVLFSFLPVGTAPSTPPGGSGWTTGAWTTVTNGSTTTYLAYILIGPNGTVTLAAGEYVVWVYLQDAYGTPVRQPGTLTITAL